MAGGKLHLVSELLDGGGGVAEVAVALGLPVQMLLLDVLLPVGDEGSHTARHPVGG